MIGGDYRQTVDPGILAYSLVNCAVNQPPMHAHSTVMNSSYCMADNLNSRLDMHQNEVTAEVIYCYLLYVLSSMD